jgi:hypothetical protein
MQATNLRKTGRFKIQKSTGPVERTPTNLNELYRLLDAESGATLPIRPQGAGTAATDCNTSETGTNIKTAGLDRIVNIDTYNHTATVQAGVRLNTLVKALAEHGLELVGSYDLQGRTVGGAISAPCFGPCIGNQGAYFSSHVIAMKVIRPDGQLMKIEPQQKNLLSAFRMSFGALGIIYEATIQVRPIRTFSASHRRVTIEKFSSVVDALANGEIGLKFYVLPYRDRVYLDLRRYDSEPGNAYTTPWKLKDWGESTILPHVFKSLNRVVPIPTVRYRMIDSISEATQELVNSRFVSNGTNAASQSNHHQNAGIRGCNYSTWCFPAANFSLIVKAYRDFCEATLATTNYRCDLPAIGYRLCQDASSLLSPSFDEPMIALTTASTQLRGWDDFVIDLAEFAEQWAGTPLISQSRAARAGHAQQTYTNRLDFFRRMRQQLDPENRLLSPFLAQYCQ